MMPARLYRTTEAEIIMKQSIFHPAHRIAAIRICAASLCAVASVNLQANDLQVGRYSLITAAPTQAQSALLAAAITVHFPERVQTVGEAVQYLLQRSGYRLAAPESIGPDTVALFALPLPAVHRNLGPMTLRSALETLVGPFFRLVQDPVHRLISFDRCVPDQVAVQEAGNTIEKVVVQDDE